jgi:hypothetical protein
MSYIHITRTPGQDLDSYRKVRAALGSEPVSGRDRHYAGEVDGALVVVDVWRSRADADRFAAERLFPAFAAAGMSPQSSTQFTVFEDEASEDAV